MLIRRSAMSVTLIADYFRTDGELIKQYELPALKSQLEALLAAPLTLKEPISLRELCSLELQLVLVLREEHLDAKIQRTLQLLRESVSPANVEYFELALVRVRSAAKRRALLYQMIASYFEECELTMEREALRSRVGFVSFISLLICGLVGGLVAALSQYTGQHFGTLPPVMIMGATGGFVSLFLRTRREDFASQGPLSIWVIGRGDWWPVLAPMFGAIFAGLFVLLIASGAVKGDLFPAFAPLPDLHDRELVSNIRAASGEDSLKLWLYAFLAGFSERLVPSMLERFASVATGTAKAPNGAKASPDDDDDQDAPAFSPHDTDESNKKPNE